MKIERLSKENSILLVIDIQDKLAEVMDRKKEVIKNANILINAFQLFEIPIIVTEQYPEGLGKTTKVISDQFNEKVKVFDKITFSGYRDNIKNEIDKLNKKKVIIVGMETHICVYQTAMELFNSGYQVYIVKDGCCSRTEENRQNGFELMEKLGRVILTNTETVVYEIMEKAGTDEFKKILELIK